MKQSSCGRAEIKRKESCGKKHCARPKWRREVCDFKNESRCDIIVFKGRLIALSKRPSYTFHLPSLYNNNPISLNYSFLAAMLGLCNVIVHKLTRSRCDTRCIISIIFNTSTSTSFNNKRSCVWQFSCYTHTHIFIAIQIIRVTLFAAGSCSTMQKTKMQSRKLPEDGRLSKEGE